MRERELAGSLCFSAAFLLQIVTDVEHSVEMMECELSFSPIRLQRLANGPLGIENLTLGVTRSDVVFKWLC